MSADLSAQQFIQYSKQILLPECGEQGQQTLLNSAVTVVGVGGLGHLVVQYLAAAGVGQIQIIDHDQVEASNLPRQLLFSREDIGQGKASVAKSKLTAAYSDCCILMSDTQLDDVNIDEMIDPKSSIVIDCTDNLRVRHLINRHCVKHHKGLFSGAISANDGQIVCYNFIQPVTSSGCYQCLVPQEAIAGLACHTQGILGPSAGIIASSLSLFTVQHLLNCFTGFGKLYRFDAANFQWHSAQVTADEQCHVCQSQKRRNGNALTNS